MAAPGILDAEAEGRRLEAADQPVDDIGDVWTEHFGPPQSEVADDQPSPTTGGGRRLRPQSTSATDPVGAQMLGGDGLPLINATQPIINLEVDGPSMPGGPSMPPGINTGIHAATNAMAGTEKISQNKLSRQCPCGSTLIELKYPDPNT